MPVEFPEGGLLSYIEKVIETEYNKEIICPHCFEAQSEPQEMLTSGDGDNGYFDCDSCHKRFYAIKHLEVTYSTYIDEDK